MTQSNVRKRLNELKAALAEKHEITLDAVISEMKNLAFFNASSYIDFTDEGMPFINLSKMTRDDMASLDTFDIDFQKGTMKLRAGSQKLAALRILLDIAIARSDFDDDEDFEIRHVFEFPHNNRDRPFED